MRPDAQVADMTEIDVDALVAEGIHCVLVDLDNTCVPRGSDEVPDVVAAWCDRAKGAGLSIMVVSNNFRARHVSKAADALGVPHALWAMKPLPFSLLAAARGLGADPSEAVMIGDQPYTDVLAGNLAGMRTILVEPQSPETEPRYTKLMRWVFSAKQPIPRQDIADAKTTDDGDEGHGGATTGE